MMTKALMFLTFAILCSFLAVAIMLLISFAIEERKMNRQWLECYCSGYYHFKICTWGKFSKVVTLDEYRYNEKRDEYLPFNRVVSYYSNDFRPNPNNKNKSLDCYGIAKKIYENACHKAQIKTVSFYREKFL